MVSRRNFCSGRTPELFQRYLIKFILTVYAFHGILNITLIWEGFVMDEQTIVIINERLTKLSLGTRMRELLADGLSRAAALSRLREEIEQPEEL
jgi:hypothetical protein